HMLTQRTNSLMEKVTNNIVMYLFSLILLKARDWTTLYMTGRHHAWTNAYQYIYEPLERARERIGGAIILIIDEKCASKGKNLLTISVGVDIDLFFLHLWLGVQKDDLHIGLRWLIILKCQIYNTRFIIVWLKNSISCIE
ncbi:hypothetical protein ACJX0J_040319, partial [Zea mays]